jgi:hypothetical protein
MSDAKTFYRCKLCGREFGSLSAWYNHLIRLHSESEPEWSRAMRLEGRRVQLWRVLRDVEDARLVERFRARACCGRCLYYSFVELKCRKRPQLVLVSPVSVCSDFAWSETPDEAAVEMIRLDGLDEEIPSTRKRRPARERARVAVAWRGGSGG